MKIGSFDLSKEVLVVAEIGNNHEGSYMLAEELIGLAAEAGAGAVKFQTIVPRKLVSEGQVERVRELERICLKTQDFEELSRVARKAGLLFFSTPFDLESARFLDPIVDAYKIASGDNDFLPLIRRVAETGKPILLSSGLSTLGEISERKDFIRRIWAERGASAQMAVLHCVTSYPTPLPEANLLAIRTLGDLGVTVGYSDHTLGIEACVLAVAVGARIVEKHFTKDKNYSDFRDHRLSADPAELRKLAERIREAELMLGDGIKRVMECEKALQISARRSIAAAADLQAGTLLSLNHLTWLRPGGGLAPGEEQKVLGKTLKRAVRAGEMILPEDVGKRG
ncbi:MAG: N-acetylneuraminate synthase family protein [Thermodesulfobacteriota bacterium]